ncbi:MAG: hypothetical protein ACP5UA_01830 [Candidatus Hydrogenedens sp.]
MKKTIILITELIIISGAFLWVCIGLKTVFLGDTLTSRLATVYALTYHHTWYINQSSESSPNPFENRTVDKVQGKEGIISSKPPILSLFMTLEYPFLRWMGYSLDNNQDNKPIARIMIILNVIIPYLIAVLFIWKFLYEIKTTPPVRIIILLGLLYGTQWSAFASHFTNHVPATSYLIIGLYFIWKSYCVQSSVPLMYYLLIGLCASLVYTIDLPLTIFIACAILFLLIKKKNKPLPWIIIGALPILIIHLVIMYHITGNILPVQISKEPFLFESSYWRHPAGPDALHHPKSLYAFNILFGAKGLFILYPILIFGLCIYLPHIWKTLHNDTKLISIFFLISFIILNMYYIFSTNNYGGVSYGFRWHIGCMPLLTGMSIPYIENRKRTFLFWVFWIVFFLISLYSTYECRTYPWSVDKEWTTRLIFGSLI